MCAIAGYCGTTDRLDANRALLQRMIGAIAHRGPDAQDQFVDAHAGLGHARLSIVDLFSGHQPMANADGNIWISFNGEIFNYVELRKEMIARGRHFRTMSDTEVILHIYEEKGLDCVDDLNGDFGFAIWDARRRRLMLARDRMGVRPVYYTTRRGCLYFASEVKALLQVPDIYAELDPAALDQMFTLWFPLSPRTPFKNIQELPPGHVLISENGNVTVRPYWRLDYPDADDADGIDRRSEDEIAEELRSLLLDATRIRLRSDVPVGAYLSGGLDSAIVATAMKRLQPERLRTFSVVFESAEFDEGSYQQEMVRTLGTAHTSVLCTTADIGRMFPDVISATERPILRTAPAPLFALSELVHRNGYKVVLTGEGADEVFAGYDIFKEAKIRRFCAALPQSRLRPLLLQRLYPYLPGLKGQSQKYLEAFFHSRLNEVADPLFSHLPRFRNTAGAKQFFSGDIRATLHGYNATVELRDRLPENFTRWHPLSQAQYLETAYLLPGYILSSQGDRVAMAHAVEGRFPFLDHRVVEFAARIPPNLKMKVLREKHILREAMRDMLPAVIGNRTKQPYRAPDAQSFFGTAAPAYVAGRLSASEIAGAGYFEPRAVEKLTTKCANSHSIGFRDNVAFVGILSTQIWHDTFVHGGVTDVASSAA